MEIEVSDENNQLEAAEQVELSKVKKKRVRLNIGVKPEDGREKKKMIPGGVGRIK